MEILTAKIKNVFDTSKRLYCSINVKYKNDTLEFSDAGELKAYRDLPSQVEKFHIYFAQEQRCVSLYSRNYHNLGFSSEVKSGGDSDYCCAGAVEEVNSFIQNHKTWYHFVTIIPFGHIALGILGLSGPIYGLLERVNQQGRFATLSIVSALALTTTMALTNGFGLPSGAIVIHKEENIVRRYSPEIAIFFALVGALTGILALFLKLK